MNRSSLAIISTLFGGAATIILLLVAGQSNAHAGGQVEVPAQLPQWGPDIQVNPTPTGSPYHPMQVNFSMAVNPTNQNNAIAGWDSFQSINRASGYAWSTDKGSTWSGGEFDGPWDPQAMVPIGNVTTAFDAHGTGYYVSQAQGSNVAGYFVLTTTTGTNWSTPVPVVTFDGSTGYNQGHLAVDPRSSGLYSGSLYMFWFYTDLNYPNFSHGVRERYSRDGGRTWSADVQVSDPSNDDIFYPFGAVASDGTVYVTFEELDGYSPQNAPKLYLVRSTDGGQTWGTNQLITGAPIVPMGRLDWEGFEPALVGSADCNYLMHVNHYPMIAVSPTDSNIVYSVWNDGRWESPDSLCGRQGLHSDVAFSRSTDGGVTWNAPVRINDDPVGNQADHFQPDIAIGPNGLVGVTWFDRRYDPNHLLYDVDYSQSSDGGLTWSPNQRVSDNSSDPNQLWDYESVDNLGYRRSLVFGSDYVLPSWENAVTGILAGNFFTDHGVFGAATPTLTPTLTPTGTGTPTNTPTDMVATSTPTGTSTTTPSSGTATSAETQTPAQATATSTPIFISTATSVVTSTATTPPVPTATSCTIQFTDIQSGSTFYSFVRCLACQGIISGYPCGGPGEQCDPSNNPYFRPGNNVTRAQAAKIIANSANYQDTIPSDRQTFSDVPPGSTFWVYIERVALHGAIHGYQCGGLGEPCPGTYFRPANNLTRGQLAQIDATVAGYQDVIPPGRQTFNDVPTNSTFWLVIERVYLHGIISGYPCGGPREPCPGLYFRPSNNVTRGQTAKIATNTFFPDCNPSGRRYHREGSLSSLDVIQGGKQMNVSRGERWVRAAGSTAAKSPWVVPFSACIGGFFIFS